jgi:hypothetical protein
MTMTEQELERQKRLRRQDAPTTEFVADPVYPASVNARGRSEMIYSNSPLFTPLDMVAGALTVVMILGPLLAGGSGWGG